MFHRLTSSLFAVHPEMDIPTLSWGRSSDDLEPPGLITSLLILACLSLAVLTDVSRWTWVSRYKNVSILDFVADKDNGGGEW